jgi:ribosomal protein S27E
MMARKKSEITCALCGKIIIGKEQTANQAKIIAKVLNI